MGRYGKMSNHPKMFRWFKNGAIYLCSKLQEKDIAEKQFPAEKNVKSPSKIGVFGHQLKKSTPPTVYTQSAVYKMSMS
jgi:hypothetical protein